MFRTAPFVLRAHDMRSRLTCLGLAFLLPTVAHAQSTPRRRPVVDPAVGRAAVLAWGEFMDATCAHPQSATLPGGGVVDAASLCEARSYAPPEALASGAFRDPGRDDVLVRVPSGNDRARGDVALVWMHREASAFRVDDIVVGQGFEAYPPLSFDGRDHVLVCMNSGAQGLYASQCGFDGTGLFDLRTAPSVDDTFSFVSVLAIEACTAERDIAIQRIRRAGSLVRVALRVTRGVPERTGRGCRLRRRASSFVVEFRVDGARLRRVTTLPPELTSESADPRGDSER